MTNNSFSFFFSQFNKSNKNPIKVAFYNRVIKYGGLERVTSILFQYFQKEKTFLFYLITLSGILKGEYSIPKNIKRICLYNKKNKLYEAIDKNNIDILVYNRDNAKEIRKLNKLNKTKVIFCIHSSFFYNIYEHIYNIEKTAYKEYKKCKYVLALIPFENDYLFKKWGINSILIENPSTFEYELVTPSNLFYKNIIMIGRGNYLPKRFELGIKSMSYIVKEIPECKMFIISSPYKNIKASIHNCNLEKNIIITGFQKNPGTYLKNSSLHIFLELDNLNL